MRMEGSYRVFAASTLYWSSALLLSWIGSQTSLRLWKGFIQDKIIRDLLVGRITWLSTKRLGEAREEASPQRGLFSKELRPQLEFCYRSNWDQQWEL
jgi:hypothetical protein